MRRASFALAWLVVLTAACDGVPGSDGDDDDRGKVAVTVEVPLGGIPDDGQCTQITAVRLSDFEVSSYQGVLDGAIFTAREGEHRVTAIAYAPPCDPAAAEPPWVADEQIVDFIRGANTLTLNFRTNVDAGVDPIFWDDVDPELVLQAGSTVRTGRNFEDTAGGNYAVDGWDVMQIGLPPNGGGGAPSTTFLFSTQTSGALPYTARGMARLADGRFVFQLAESTSALRVFSGAGTFLENWPVVLDPGMIQFDSTDGLERADATHLVRTAWLNTPTGCPGPEGPTCIQSALEILEQRTGPTGNFVAVSQQILLPAPYNQEYPLGVTPAPTAGRYIVSTLPGGPDSRVLMLTSAGAIVAGPVTKAGSDEGLFLNTALTKLGTLTYEGALAMHNPNTLAPRAGEVFSYALGVGASNPVGVAWNGAAGNFVVLHGTNQLSFANETFTAGSPTPINASGYIAVSGIDVNSDSGELLLIDRFPPIDAGTGLRIATIDAYNLTTGALASSTQLDGVPADVRPRTLAYLGAGQVASHHRRPGGVVDPALDGTIFVNNLDGSLAAVINLSAWGVHRILDLNYLPATDEILLLGTDVDGVVRLMVTTRGGTPVRSYRTDTIFGITDMAPIGGGAFAGQVGVVTGQPSSFLRIATP